MPTNKPETAAEAQEREEGFDIPETTVDRQTGEVVPAELATVAQLKAALVDNLADPASLLNLVPRVTVPAGGGTTWLVPFPDGTVSTDTLELHILAAGRARAFWAHELGDGNVFPDCASGDGVAGSGVRWDGDPEGAHDCKTCPMAAWGTSAKSDRGQACREFRLMLGISGGRMILVRVPPTSLKVWDAYAVDLALSGKSIWQVYTQLHLERTKSASGIVYSQVVPLNAGPVTAADRAASEPLARLLRQIVREGAATFADTTRDELGLS